MFKKIERIETGSLNSISISYGILYELSIFDNPNPKPITKEIEKKDYYGNVISKRTMRLTQFENIKLHSFVIENNKRAGKSAKFLEGLDKDVCYNMELSNTLANKLMDLIDSLSIEFMDKFFLTKVDTGNEFEPDLKIEKAE